MLRAGELVAILAAAANGTIGIFNRYGFASHGSYVSLSFFKCLGAFLLISAVVCARPSLRRDVGARRKDLLKIAIASFCGIFVLFYFETWAFSITSIPVVSFLSYAAGIVTVGLGILFLNESFTITKMISILLVFSGIFQMFGGLRHWDIEIWGALIALFSGLGYSLFLFLWKKFEIPSSLGSLWWFFGCGTLYLAVPFVWNGFPIPDANTWPSIAALIVIPTLGGYYLTSRALSLTEASNVQLIETSDPLFSSFYAYLLFSDTLTSQGLLGAAAIFAGLLLLIVGPRLLP